MYRAGLHSFVVRRALQRMEQGEITPLEAAKIVRQSSDCTHGLLNGDAPAHCSRQPLHTS